MKLRVLRIRGEFINYSLVCAHVLTEDKNERQKDRLYETKEDVQEIDLVCNTNIGQNQENWHQF